MTLLTRIGAALVAVAAAVGVVLRVRRRVEPGPGRRGDGGGSPGGVREPRRPSPAPSGAAMAVGEDGEAVQVR